MKRNTSGGLAKCERTEECTRDAVGTVRTPWYPVGHGDVPTCTEHAGGMVIWGFGKRSPYTSSNPTGRR